MIGGKAILLPANWRAENNLVYKENDNPICEIKTNRLDSVLNDRRIFPKLNKTGKKLSIEIYDKIKQVNRIVKMINV